MKKIFLPLLALVGMVTGFTLSSCGGGGGGNRGAAGFFAGATYKVEGGSSGEMTLIFSDQASPDGQFIEATACWNDDNNTTSSCRVQVTDAEYTGKRLSRCTMTFYGFDSESVSDAHVLVFYGLATNNAENEGTQSIGTVIQVQGTLGQVNQPANATMYTQYVKFDEAAADEDDADGDGAADNVDPAPDDVTIVPVIITRTE